MPKMIVKYEKLVQDSQDYGSTDEHMVSRVFFALTVDGVTHPNLYADVKQPVGGNFESDALEISKPVGYNGPFNHTAFVDETEKYFRRLVGASGSGIRIAGGGNIRMRNNTFITPATVAFDVEGGCGGW